MKIFVLNLCARSLHTVGDGSAGLFRPKPNAGDITMAFLDSSIGGAARSIDFEDVAEARESAAAKSPLAQTGAEILEAMARKANGAVLWFCELATVAAVALGLTMVFEVSVWKQFVAATSATLFMTVAACVGAYVLMLRADELRDRW